MSLSKALLISLLSSFVLSGWAQDWAPFVILDNSAPASLMAARETGPVTTDSTRVTTRDGHFFVGDERVRFWGINTSFAAGFPEAADAPMVAERLAGMGVNSVRLHHMDSSLYPNGLWDKATGKRLEEKALVDLDRFIDALAARGIYCNLNLHVGRAHSKFLDMPDPNSEYDKVVGIFTPQVIEAQKDFARNILGRINTVRKVRYADDPAVALVEITNEDSFFMWDGNERLRALPPFYADIIKEQYNAWLKAHYESTDAVRAEWSKGDEALGRDLVENGAFQTVSADSPRPAGWNLEQHETCRATATATTWQGLPAVALAVSSYDSSEGRLQYNQGGKALSGDKYYTVMFKAAASKPRSMYVGVGMAHDPWDGLGLYQSVDLTTEWQSFRLGFVCLADDANGRVNFAFGGDDGTIYLSDVQFRSGGLIALEEGESLDGGTIALYSLNEAPLRQRDRLRFLAETEKAYFDEMRRFIKMDMGCRALVTGTIVFGPLGQYAQSDMDFVDSHSYWRHPSFPGVPWDSGNWIVEQDAMASQPEKGIVFGLAGERLAGKPFTVTEYNHAAPNDYQAECVPIVAAFAAAHDWDGVWLYGYKHGRVRWSDQSYDSYFDIQANPAKWGFMRAGAALMNEKALLPLAAERTVPLLDNAQKDAATQLAALHARYGSSMISILEKRGALNRLDLLTTRSLLTLMPSAAAVSAASSDEATKIGWDVANGKGLFAAQGRGAWVYAGFAERFAEATDGRVRLEGPEFCALMVTALDGGELAKARRVLISACGRCENTGMEFSADRRTVGRNWGEAPVRIQPANGRLTLPPGDWRCQALGPDGKAIKTVPVEKDKDTGDSFINMSSEYGTMWYLLQQPASTVMTY